MASQPLVSIIINNYNYDRFLTEAIDSALSQTYPNVEVIVVDDGSTDRSREMINGYGDRLTPVLKQNGGQASAFNAGFLVSQGDIIFFLDADDMLFPSAVARVVAIWQPNLAKIHFRLNVVNDQGISLGYSYPQGCHLAEGNICASLLSNHSYSTTPTSGKAFSRDALAQILPMPEVEFRIAADGYLTIAIPFYGQLAAIEEPLGAYRIHGNNGWAVSTIAGERFRRFVQYDKRTQQLLMQKAQEFGYDAPDDLEFRSFGSVWSRLISLRLEPKDHPIASDRAVFLMRQGVRSLWKYSSLNWQKRLIFSLWFVWVGLMPLPFAKPAIGWLFAPQSRPKVIGWTLTQLRTLVS